MRHLNEAVLRRIDDDRFAASNRERRHLDSCARCQRRLEAVTADAGLAARLFAAPAPAVAVEPALAHMRARVAADDGAGARAARPVDRHARRWALGLVTVPLVVIALVATASAAGWLSVFSPTQVAPITLTAGELNGLPDLSGYGHMQVNRPTTSVVSGPAAAAAATGLRVLLPGPLPPGIPATAVWTVIGHGSATFTLDSAAAAAAAAAAGRSAPQVPSALDGTTVTVQAGPAVAAVYGGSTSASNDAFGDIPTLVIAETVRPTASTNGASLQALEAFLLAQPGMSPQLAAEIRAIGAPSSTLPIPVISDLMTSETVTIDGVQGVVAGDSTGLGAAAIWEKGGVVYAVGGLLPQSEILGIARSLH